MPEILPELLICIGCDPQSPDVKYLRIKKSLGVGRDVIDQGADKVLGLSAACSYEYPIPSMNVTKDLALRGELVRIATLDFFKTRAMKRRHFSLLPPHEGGRKVAYYPFVVAGDVA